MTLEKLKPFALKRYDDPNYWTFEIEENDLEVFVVSFCDYDFLSLEETKRFHKWLGQAIAYIEAKK